MKVKWWMIILLLTVIWAFSTVVSLPGLTAELAPPVKIAIFRGFCSFQLDSVEHFEGERMLIMMLIIFAIVYEALLCGVPTVIFSGLTFWFMKKSLLSDSDAPKRAIVKSLLFISIGAVLFIINGTIYPIILLVTLPDPRNIDLEQTSLTLSIRDHLADIYLSFTSLITPIAVIVFLKSARDAFVQLIRRCFTLDQMSS